MCSSSNPAKLVVIDCRDMDTLGQELLNIKQSTLRPYALIFPVEFEKKHKIKVKAKRAVAVVSRVEEAYFPRIQRVTYNDPIRDFIPAVAKVLQNTSTIFLDFSSEDPDYDKLPAGAYIKLRELLKDASFESNQSLFATRPDTYRKEWYKDLTAPARVKKIQKFLLKKKAAYFVTDGRRATLIHPEGEMRLNPRKEGWAQRLKNKLPKDKILLADYSPYYDLGVLPCGIFRELEKAGIKHASSGTLLTATETLSKSELESHIAAAHKWVDIRDDLLSWLDTNLKRGVSELDVEKRIITLLQEDDEYRYLFLPDFPAIVASGEHANSPHHRSTDAQIASGSIILVDYYFRIDPRSWRRKTGKKNDTAWVDATFLAYFGDPPPEVKKDFEVVKKAISAGIKLAKRRGSQATFRDIAIAVNSVIREYLRDDYDKYIKHHVGHALGVGVHGVHGKGFPIKEDFDIRIPPGYLFTIEPGIYRFGTRIETNVVMTQRRAIQTIPLQEKLYTFST